MIPSYMLTLSPADFRSSALRITPDKSHAIVTLIEQPSSRVSPPFKIHFPVYAPAHKSQILQPLSLTATPPRRNHHGITSLCMPHRITSIDSHPCGKTGGVGVFFFPPTVENVHNAPHNFPQQNFAGARKSNPAEFLRIPSHSSLRRLQFLHLQSVPYPSVSN